MPIGNPVSLTGNISAKSISVTATAGQTLFTVTGGYRVNQISVFRNGTRLVDSLDYTARDGSSVTLLSAATLGDTIEFQVFDDFRAADALDVNSGGTVNGNVNIGSSISLYSSTGIITAAKYYGDGSELTGVAAAGSGGTTGITTQTFFSNSNFISTSYTLNYPNHNYGMFGPVSISIGSTITVGAGNTFVIV